MSAARHVISIDPFGGLHGLQMSGGLPLTALGRAKIERISEVIWREAEQRWVVVFRKGPLKGRPITRIDLHTYGIAMPTVRAATDGVLLFEEYAHGVAAEIALVEAALLRGQEWGKEAQ